MTQLFRRTSTPLSAGPVLFMHLPKTAGRSMLAGLMTALQPALAVDGFDRLLFGGFDAFHRFAPADRSLVHLSPDTIPADADLVGGHFALSTLRARFPHGRLMTVLREPRTRLLSLWLYWRQVTDETLAGVPGWSDRVRLARGPLDAFLRAPAVAAQTDNLFVRALLWPHPLLPTDGFIRPEHDRRLLRLARRALRGFELVDVVENHRLAGNIGDWLRTPFALPRINETAALPPSLRAPLHRELGADTFRALDARTRLDRALWSDVVRRERPAIDPDALAQRVFAVAVARYALLMAG